MQDDELSYFLCTNLLKICLFNANNIRLQKQDSSNSNNTSNVSKKDQISKENTRKKWHYIYRRAKELRVGEYRKKC